jgi:hypothetical protein
LLFATAAEDATLRIMSPSDNAMEGPWGSFRTHRILKAHDSGIQHVAWSKDGQYLFSSAADEEFFVWKVGSVPSFGITVMLLAKAPTPDVKSEVRITNFDMVEVEESGSGKGFLLCLTMSNSKIKVCAPIQIEWLKIADKKIDISFLPEESSIYSTSKRAIHD